MKGKLSPREMEVAKLVAVGKAAKEISDILVISKKTVETHRAHIYKSLGIHTVAELVHWTIRTGAIQVLGEEKRMAERFEATKDIRSTINLQDPTVRLEIDIMQDAVFLYINGKTVCQWDRKTGEEFSNGTQAHTSSDPAPKPPDRKGRSSRTA